MAQCGSVTISFTASKTQFEKQVTFSPAFAGTPTVVCCLSDTGPHQTTAYINCMAYDVKNTGFKAILKKFKKDTNAYSVTLYWIAMYD